MTPISGPDKTFIHKLLLTVGIVCLTLFLLFIVYFTFDVILLMFAAALLAIFLRGFGNDLDLAEKFLQNRVITVPGVAFGSEAKGFLRISFVIPKKKWQKASGE